MHTVFYKVVSKLLTIVNPGDVVKSLPSGMGKIDIALFHSRVVEILDHIHSLEYVSKCEH